MVEIDIICVGSLKTEDLKKAEKNIEKRTLPKYKINIIEVEDEKNNTLDREAEIEKVKDTEAKRILSKLKKGSYVITMEIGGKPLKEKSLAKYIDDLHREHVSIIIGGSVGLGQEVSRISNRKISISKMTFPHQVMRLVILEQFL